MNYYVTKNYQRSVEALENWFKDKSNFPIKNISISPIICSEFPEDIEDKSTWKRNVSDVSPVSLV